MSESQKIFVFGSNLAGRHGKGAALYARQHYGAAYGVGKGRTGNSYAIPTKDRNLPTLPLDVIEAYCFAFIEHARANPRDIFLVTPVGTGLAGYSVHDIAPFFANMPSNCEYADSWNFPHD